MGRAERNTVLVVAEARDPLAGSVEEVLRSDGFDVVVASPSALVGGAVTYFSDAAAGGGNTMWASTVSASTVSASTVSRSTGLGERAVASTELGAVFNRAVHLGGVGFADEDDESYAVCERMALFVAMIESLDCPVLNSPRGTSLSGPSHLEVEWMATAARCGLAVRGLTWTSDGVELEPTRTPAGTATVIGDRVLPVSQSATVMRWIDEHRGGALSLATALGCGLLRLELGVTATGRCVVTRIDPLPAMLEPAATVEVARHLARGLAPIRRWERAS